MPPCGWPEQPSSPSSADPDCEDQAQPTALLLAPTCREESTTLVCLIQGLAYQWPINVTWERDGEVLSQAFATEQAQAQGKCNFVVASRLRVKAAAWGRKHEYTCRAKQGDVATNEASVQSEGQPSSDPFKVQLSLQAGQVIFLLLISKSFVYGIILGIYTVCKKTDF